MTQSVASRSSSTRRPGRHRAVVMGASMGGLLAARVLSETFEQVVVFERDDLAEATGPRKGVPQGRHGHALHPAGRQVLDTLFPGFTEEVATDGAQLFSSSLLQAHLNGHHLVRADMGAPFLSTSRPFLEWHVRRRVAAVDNVEIRDRHDVIAPVVSASGDRVLGLRVRPRAEDAPEEVVDADLVVDATGRAGRSLRWLDELGYERPREEELHVGVAYATRHLRLPEGVIGSDRVVLVGPEPGRLTGMYLAAQEHGWWILTVFGCGGSEPPSDAEGFADFVAAVAPSDVAAALRDAEPLSDIFTHRLPSNLRRRYEGLRRFPKGFLVFGDAICSFNPIYGQGMTVAAMQAMALRRELQRRRFDARRFFRAAAHPIGDAWDLATGSDLSLPEIEGPRPPKVRVLNAYVDRVLQAAEGDALVSQAFLRVVGMLERPQSLLHPRVAIRVARHAMRRPSRAVPAATPRPTAAEVR